MTAAPEISANIVDVVRGEIRPGTVRVAHGRIAEIVYADSPRDTYLIPGFVDAHVHIESSMLVPTEFARLATPHGTVATVSDPHEIANVLGGAGVWYMVDNAAQTPLKVNFGAPSCVPATPFDKAGGAIDAEGVAALLDDPRIKYLSEMMNFPGVLMGDEQVHAKIAAAHQRKKPVDGHAPGVRGADLNKYLSAGISTDHESRAYDEGLEKLQKGMKLIIREGSAAKDFQALHLLLRQFPDACMFCSDDKHPHDLVEGHINQLVVRAVAAGIDPMIVLRAACVTPVRHYKLDVGLLHLGDRADFVEVRDLTNFEVLRTWINGELVAEHGGTLLPRVEPVMANNFQCAPVSPDLFKLPTPTGWTDGVHAAQRVRVIEALDGQLVTNALSAAANAQNGEILADQQRDLLKMVLVDRYTGGPPAVCLVKNFGLARGAIASSVSHDSHNLIAVGASDAEISLALNALVHARGGISLAAGDTVDVVPLPIAGLMSGDSGERIAADYSRLDAAAKSLGSPLFAPYMTLSFMALTVIPALKLGPAGLFDVHKFGYVGLVEEGK
ncbi:MAG: adenine deaminase [Pirellulales bacterium]|nr:adenine deaminase [Pirellulales bacterium]